MKIFMLVGVSLFKQIGTKQLMLAMKIDAV